MKIRGLKKAVRECRNWLEGNPRSAQIMLDRSTGKVWTDVYCNNSGRCNYTDPAIICVSEEVGIDFDYSNAEIAQQINGTLECFCDEYEKIVRLRNMKLKKSVSYNCEKEKMKISGFAEALDEYNRTRHKYGMVAYIMLDRVTGEMWTDVVADNDNRYAYPSDAIVCISESYARDMLGCEDINSACFDEYIRCNIADYAEEMTDKNA